LREQPLTTSPTTPAVKISPPQETKKRYNINFGSTFRITG
jgi:hypothetical protein